VRLTVRDRALKVCALARVRRATECASAQTETELKGNLIVTMQLTPNASSDRPAAPVDVFYIVLTQGERGERGHSLRSPLYDTRDGAEPELTRLRAADGAGSYGIWRSTTYIERGEWLHRVLRSDGTLILPRLHGVEKCAEPDLAH